MKWLIFVLLLLCSSAASPQQDLNPFLPDIFKDYPNVRDIAISPDGKKIYFSIDDYKSKIALIAVITKTDSGWSGPKAVPFTGNYRDIEPAFSPDGKKLYFASNRPLDDQSSSPKDYDIWVVEREVNGWSEARNLGPVINSDKDEFFPSVTVKGDVYFTSTRESAVGREDIFVSRLSGAIFQEPVALKGGVNTEYYEFNAFIDPNEKFIIFSALRPNEGMGGGDLYISFNEDQTWSEAKLIKKINSPYLDFCPFVDVKNNRFYFTSQRTAVKEYYEDRLSVNGFLNLLSSNTSKGLNRLYFVDLSIVLNGQ